ncbi:MAG: hypothetical protein U1F43_30490 [Myxococcota bacterium]
MIGLTERDKLHDDIVGSTVLMDDAAGREVNRNEFYPYGETCVATRGYQETYGFANKEKDLGSGLFLLRRAPPRSDHRPLDERRPALRGS